MAPCSASLPDLANPRARGFTLIELLVCIAIIAVLIGILLPALSRGRALCKQVREQSSAAQLMVGFLAYSHDSKGRVMVGYASKKMVSGSIVVHNAAGERLTGEVAQRFPWRIIPYMAGEFRGLYQDPKVVGAIAGASDYPDAAHSYDYVISLFPSLGMNSTWIGGSDLSGEFGKDFVKLFGRPYITRIDEAQRPTELIAFASARVQPQDQLPWLDRPEGFFRVESPYFTESLGRQWETSYDRDASLPGANSGFVSLRHFGKAVTAMMDGHAEMAGWGELNDMRMWADKATSAEWALGTKTGS